MVTSSDSLHTISFDLFDNIKKKKKKKSHIYDAMSSKSAHLSISQKSPQYKFWCVCHQYFISRPLGFFLSELHTGFFQTTQGQMLACIKDVLPERIRPDHWNKLTSCGRLTNCVKTLIFCLLVSAWEKMLSVSSITSVYWQVNALALCSKALSQFCGYAKQQSACALCSTVGSVPAGLLMNNWIIHHIYFSVNMERKKFLLFYCNFNFVMT